MSAKLRRAHSLVREKGLRRSAPFLLGKLLGYLVERETGYVIEQCLDDASSEPAGRRVELSEASPADARQFVALAEDRALQRRAECYLQHGYRCFLGTVDGVLAGQMWWVDATKTGEHRHPHLNRYRIQLGPRDMYGFDFYVLPSLRGRGTATAFLASTDGSLRAKGYARHLGYVERDNTPARRLYDASGRRVVRTVHSLCLVRRILIVDERVFVRNSRWSRPHGWDYRAVWPRGERPPGSPSPTPDNHSGA